MPINIRGIKARPHDIDQMLTHKPSFVEIHCSAGDLDWMPQNNYDLPFAVHVPEYTKDGRLLDPAGDIAYASITHGTPRFPSRLILSYSRR